MKKLDFYSDIQRKDALLTLKAIAHPMRNQILKILNVYAYRSVQELEVGLIDLPQSEVSRHLKILKDVGAVSCRRKGKWIEYFVSDANIEIIENAQKYVGTIKLV